MTIAGADASSYQGSPRNWLPIAGKIAYAGVKITEYSAGARKYENPDAAADWAALKAAGLGRVAYAYAHPAAPVRASVTYFLDVLDGLGLEDGDMIALDYETADGLTPRNASQWALAALELISETTGRPCLLYTFRSFADEGYCTGLGGHPLWLADPSSPAGHPSVPAPWHDWALHQWDISSPLDRDVANFPSLAAMRSALGRKEPKVTIASIKCDGKTSLAQLAAEHGTGASTILRLTAEHGKYSAPVAAYLDAVFAGKLPPSAPVPAGALLWVPVS
jgi:lysozyme